MSKGAKPNLHTFAVKFFEVFALNKKLMPEYAGMGFFCFLPARYREV
jgi:hypothetical protein